MIIIIFLIISFFEVIHFISSGDAKGLITGLICLMCAYMAYEISKRI